MADRRLSFNAYLAWNYSRNSCNYVPVQVPQGDDWEIIIEVYNENHLEIPVTSLMAFKWALFDVNGSVPLVSREYGVDTIDIVGNTITFYIPSSVTKDLEGDYYHEAQMINSQECRYCLLQGYLKVCPTRIFLDIPTPIPS